MSSEKCTEQSLSNAIVVSQYQPTPPCTAANNGTVNHTEPSNIDGHQSDNAVAARTSTNTEADVLKAANDAAEARISEQRVELNRLKFDQAWELEVARSGFQWATKDSAIIRKLCATDGFEILPGTDGEVVVLADNQLISPAELFARVALKNPNYFAYNDPKVAQLKAQAARNRNVSKEDFKDDVGRKIEWISKNGLEKWEQLPLRRPSTVIPSQMTASDYSRMTLQQKTEFVDRFGADSVGEILRRR